MAPLFWVKVLWKTLDVTGFELHLQHEETPIPRDRDKIIMVMMTEVCNDLDQLKSMTRVRGFLNVLFS